MGGPARAAQRRCHAYSTGPTAPSGTTSSTAAARRATRRRTRCTSCGRSPCRWPSAARAARRKVRAFVELSTGMVYKPDSKASQEGDRLKPWSKIAVYKLQAEEELAKIDGYASAEGTEAKRRERERERKRKAD